MMDLLLVFVEAGDDLSGKLAVLVQVGVLLQVEMPMVGGLVSVVENLLLVGWVRLVVGWARLLVGWARLLVGWASPPVE